MGRLLYVTGPARSGKSRWAVARASEWGPQVVFVATCRPGDPEMNARIRRHREERPAWRTTVTGQFRRGPWNGLARYSYYGKYTSSLYSYSGDDVQNYNGKGLVDAEVGIAPVRGFKVSLGARNISTFIPTG